MPRRAKLGSFVLGETMLTGDIVAKAKAPKVPLDTVLVEVKNEDKWFHASSREILEVIRKAVYVRASPVFVAAHMTAKAESLCHQLGIATLHLGRQLVPKTYSGTKRSKTEVERLRPLVLGNAPIEYVSADRFMQDGLTEAAQADLHRVSDPAWLYGAARTWESNFAEIHDCWTAGTWAAVRRAVEDRFQARELECTGTSLPPYY